MSAYLDGELAPGEQDAVERHLATCQACQWDLDTLQYTVQWTSELPAVPLPHVFTIPAPAQPERTPWWRWSFLPVLQGATALVALLLFFAVAGDFLLRGSGGARSAEPMFMQEQVPVAVEATQVVKVIKEAEAPAAPAAEVAVEKAVAETVVVETLDVEMEVAATAPSPMLQTPLAGEPASGEARATAPQEGGIEAPESVAEESSAGEAVGAPQADKVPAEQEAAPAEQDASDAIVGGGPTPTILASPLPLSSRASGAPTIVAEAPAPAPAMPGVQEEALAQTWGKPGVDWLRVAEVTLAVAFLLLVTVTIVATIQRRRAG